MSKILNGKKLSEKIIKDLGKKIRKNHLRLTLGVILVGENKVSKIYVNQKRKLCQRAGVDFKLFKFPSKINTIKLRKEIKKKMAGVSGLIIQLPLPEKIKTQEVLDAILPKKDVDCLSSDNLGKFYVGNPSISPPIISSISYIFRKYRIKIQGKNVVIIGSGRLVGKPLTVWFLQKNAAVSVINKFTKNTVFFTKNADILISGAGKPNLINGKIIKKGTTIIDAGTSYKKGRLVGDVDLKSIYQKASHIALVPGGVGPLTVAFLVDNLVKLNIKPK